jgi:hypothetical protein
LREQNPDIPEELESIVLKALAKNPDERYAGCGELARALATFEKPVAMPPIPTPPPTPPPLPGPVPVQQVSGPEAWRWQTAFFVVLLLGLIVAAVLGGQKRELRKSRDDLQIQVSDLQAQLRQAEAKVNTLGKLVEAKSWAPVAVDTFDGAWAWSPIPNPIGDQWGSMGRVVASGKYIWGMYALQGQMRFDTRSDALMGDGDYYLSVEATKTAGSGDAQCYLLLRVDGQHYYALTISNGEFDFALHDNVWKPLVDWRASSAIHTGMGQSNQLAVLTEGSHYSIFINDILVAEVTDGTLRSGSAGLAVGLSKKGDSARVEFDNFELRRRPL